MATGYFTVEAQFKQYFAELIGDSAKVWVGEGLPQYEGLIDGIEHKYPDFWEYLLKNHYIRAK